MTDVPSGNGWKKPDAMSNAEIIAAYDEQNAPAGILIQRDGETPEEATARYWFDRWVLSQSSGDLRRSNDASNTLKNEIYLRHVAALKSKQDKEIDEALDRARAIRAGELEGGDLKRAEARARGWPMIGDQIDSAFDEVEATIRSRVGSDEHKTAQADLNNRMAAQLDKMAEGRKDDAGKPPLHLIPPEYLYAVAEILDFGQRKYTPRNWEAGMDWSRCYRAALGHLLDWFARKGPDPETGKSHLWHAACCVMFLICYELRGSGIDDRPAIGGGPIESLGDPRHDPNIAGRPPAP